MNKKRYGFTLVELIGAIVIITILCAMVMVVSGTARSRTLMTRVSSDLESLNTAKSHWSLDHPQATFPSDEPSRFSAIQKYLDTVQSASMTNFEAPNVLYFINAIGANASSAPAFTP
jgi:type II secretory pathway pseudopilin PulG